MIVVLGTVCLDRVRTIQKLPHPGGYEGVLQESLGLGGEAANTANALTRWGADSILVGNHVGSGENADILLDLLAQHELRGTFTRNELAMTPVCDIYVTNDGERTMFGIGFDHLGVGIALDDLPGGAGDWFTLDMNWGEVGLEALKKAQSKGMRTYAMDLLEISDPVLACEFWQSSTDWVGTRGHTQSNVRWVKDWVERTGCFTILSDGPNGFVAGSPNHKVKSYPPFPTPKYVDSTGAGDMFRAGMLFGLSQNWPIGNCMAFASAAGCLKCRVLGATEFVPSVDQIWNWVDENPEVSAAYGIEMVRQ